MLFALIGLWSEGEGPLFGPACYVFVKTDDMHRKLVADSASTHLCIRCTVDQPKVEPAKMFKAKLAVRSPTCKVRV